MQLVFFLAAPEPSCTNSSMRITCARAAAYRVLRIAVHVLAHAAAPSCLDPHADLRQHAACRRVRCWGDRQFRHCARSNARRFDLPGPACFRRPRTGTWSVGHETMGVAAWGKRGGMPPPQGMPAVHIPPPTMCTHSHPCPQGVASIRSRHAVRWTLGHDLCGVACLHARNLQGYGSTLHGQRPCLVSMLAGVM